MTARPGGIWLLENGVEVLVISFTVYNEIATEPACLRTV